MFLPSVCIQFEALLLGDGEYPCQPTVIIPALSRFTAGLD